MIYTFSEFLTEKSKKGTYAAFRFDQGSVDKIVQYMRDHDIPNPVKPEKLHVTLLYSRKECVGYTPAGTLETPIDASVAGFDVFDTTGDIPTKALIVKLDSPKLVERHNFLMKKYGATWDYESYIPHFTMSYNVGDLDISKLPAFGEKLKLVKEYGEELNLNWAKDHG